MLQKLKLILGILFFIGIWLMCGHNLLQGVLHNELPVMSRHSDNWVSFSEGPLRYTFSLLVNSVVFLLPIASIPFYFWLRSIQLPERVRRENAPRFEDDTHRLTISPKDYAPTTLPVIPAKAGTHPPPPKMTREQEAGSRPPPG